MPVAFQKFTYEQFASAFLCFDCVEQAVSFYFLCYVLHLYQLVFLLGLK